MDGKYFESSLKPSINKNGTGKSSGKSFNPRVKEKGETRFKFTNEYDPAGKKKL